jgi:catechol 2,3-dioxygenase-like lactoylglutathione lyase family enzyme
MRFIRHVVVFDAADVAAESAFWAELLDGQVVDEDERFHCVVDASGQWRIGVQHAPDHTPPEWPDGNPQQQVHIDLHVDDGHAAHERALALGATVLRDGDLDADEGHVVYVDPAGHPFCIGWGHPDEAQLRSFLAALPSRSAS